MNDMIRVRVSMIVILQRKVRELRIMISWFTETNACTVLSQSMHLFIFGNVANPQLSWLFVKFV